MCEPWQRSTHAYVPAPWQRHWAHRMHALLLAGESAGIDACASMLRTLLRICVASVGGTAGINGMSAHISTAIQHADAMTILDAAAIRAIRLSLAPTAAHA